jgi:hypothetical protein
MYRCADLDDLLYDAGQESGIKGVEGFTEAKPIPERTICNGSIRVFARTPFQWSFAGKRFPLKGEGNTQRYPFCQDFTLFSYERF